MKNLTFPVDEELLKRARLKAVQQGTSVSRVLQTFLEQYAAGAGTQLAVAKALKLSEKHESGSGTDGRSWSRADLYD